MFNLLPLTGDCPAVSGSMWVNSQNKVRTLPCRVPLGGVVKERTAVCCSWCKLCLPNKYIFRLILISGCGNGLKSYCTSRTNLADFEFGC